MSMPPPAAMVVLDDGRLRLSPWQATDIEGLHQAVQESVAEVGRWLPWCTRDYDLAQAADWVAASQAAWASGAACAFAIRASADGRLLGGCGLGELDRKHRVGNLGYWVRSSAHGGGVATAAARLVAAFGFRQLGLGRIEIATLTDNLASRRVAAKLGAQYEGVARARLWAWGCAHDAAMHGLVPQDLGA